MTELQRRPGRPRKPRPPPPRRPAYPQWLEPRSLPPHRAVHRHVIADAPEGDDADD